MIVFNKKPTKNAKNKKYNMKLTNEGKQIMRLFSFKRWCQWKK